MAENRGGAREGSGRKPLNMDELEIQSLTATFKTWAAKTGRTVPDLLAEVAYNDNADLRVRLKAIEIYFSVAVGKRTKSEVSVDDKRRAPVIGLPTVKKKPQEALDREQDFLGTMQ